MVDVVLKFLECKIKGESTKLFSDNLPSLQGDYDRIINLRERRMDSFRMEVEVSCIISQYHEEFTKWRALEGM